MRREVNENWRIGQKEFDLVEGTEIGVGNPSFVKSSVVDHHLIDAWSFLDSSGSEMGECEEEIERGDRPERRTGFERSRYFVLECSIECRRRDWSRSNREAREK